MSSLNSELIFKLFPEKISELSLLTFKLPSFSLNEKLTSFNSKLELEINGLDKLNSKISLEILPLRKVLSSMLKSELITLAILDLTFKLKTTSSFKSTEL